LIDIINRIFFQKYDDEFKSHILEKNLKVSKILLPIITLIALSHILVFSYQIGEYRGIELYWRRSLILNHTIFGVIAFAFSIYQYLAIRHLPHLKSTLNIISHFIYIVGLGATISFALIDQMIISTITPYLIALIFIPLIIIMDIRFAIFYIALAHIIFLILYPHFQTNPDFILNKSVNSSSAAILSMIIAYINWSKNKSEFEYRKKIKEQQQELNKQNSELLNLNKNLNDAIAEKNKFFSIVAHDLRAPIGNFKTLIDELINYYEDMNEVERLEVIQLIKSSSISTYNLLEDLLEWAKSQMSESSFDKMEHDIVELIKACIKINETNLSNKSINLTFNYPDSSFLLNFDYNLIKSAILNLISNAVKFSNLGCNIEINIIKTNNDALISVKDNGIGMTQEQIETLFILSKKISQVGTKGELGSGLGLILVKDIVEEHNGKIWINSEINKGTTFTFSLPLN